MYMYDFEWKVTDSFEREMARRHAADFGYDGSQAAQLRREAKEDVASAVVRAVGQLWTIAVGFVKRSAFPRNPSHRAQAV